MKKIRVFFLLVLSGLCMLPVLAQADFEKTKIAVLPFNLQGEKFETDDMGKIVSEWLITAFVKDGRFEVIERKLLGQVLEEQQMVEAGVVNQDTAMEIGRLLGVKVIISGSVMKLGQVIEVNSRIIDVSSAAIITAENVRSTQVISLQELVFEMAEKIIKNFPLEGYVANRDANQVVIDLGRLAGVKSGMHFMVYEEGDVVRHPKTDEILYVKQIKTGTIEITGVQTKISEGIIVEEVMPDAIKYGHFVKSVKRSEKKNGKEYTIVKAKGASHLFVDTLPAAADIRILNIQPRYRRGMEVSAGNYHVEVSMAGYLSNRQWITIGEGEEKYLDIRLIREQRQSVTAPVAVQGAGHLFVDTVPAAADIRILNIQPRYRRGMELAAGNYHVEVSMAGYLSNRQWIAIGKGEKKYLDIRLIRGQRQSVTASASAQSSGALNSYLVMLDSAKGVEVRNGAKHLIKKYPKNYQALNKAEQVLLANYARNPKDRNYNDALAYLCKYLGASRDGRFRETLRTVSSKAPNKKLRKYAKSSLRQLK
ncbi:MAG: FlgO family outer membrane protein [Thermodesulfobacteriota bacterium]